MSISPQSRTVFIVDDDVSFLQSVSRLLEVEGYSVRIFESANTFLEQLVPGMSGCVLADLDMPGMNGLELQAALAKSFNPLPIVFLSGKGDIPKSVQAMRLGAEDFLTKLCSKEELLNAIGRALVRGAQERKDRGHSQALLGRFKQLSTYELEVLEQVVSGKLNKQIAANLGVHERTVKYHRTNLMRKLQVQSVAELTRLADEAGLFKRDKLT